MKKLSLLLVAILVLTTCLFVFTSCGDEANESEADSNVESETSEASDESETEETSDEVSADTSEPAEESQPNIFIYDIDRSKTKTNKALGKTYEIEDEKVFSENYPDTDNKELTDGTIGTNAGSDVAWAGIAAAESPVSIVVDLGEAVEGLADFEVSALIYDEWGINTPDTLTVYVSEDGTKYYEAGTVDVDTNNDGEGRLTTEVIKLELDKGVKAQYVKLSLEYSKWLFVSEIEISTYE